MCCGAGHSARKTPNKGILCARAFVLTRSRRSAYRVLRGFQLDSTVIDEVASCSEVTFIRKRLSEATSYCGGTSAAPARTIRVWNRRTGFPISSAEGDDVTATAINVASGAR